MTEAGSQENDRPWLELIFKWSVWLLDSVQLSHYVFEALSTHARNHLSTWYTVVQWYSINHIIKPKICDTFMSRWNLNIFAFFILERNLLTRKTAMKSLWYRTTAPSQRSLRNRKELCHFLSRQTTFWISIREQNPFNLGNTANCMSLVIYTYFTCTKLCNEQWWMLLIWIKHSTVTLWWLSNAWWHDLIFI